jgi:hypothetical protein
MIVLPYFANKSFRGKNLGVISCCGFLIAILGITGLIKDYSYTCFGATYQYKEPIRILLLMAWVLGSVTGIAYAGFAIVLWTHRRWIAGFLLMGNTIVLGLFMAIVSGYLF